LQLATLNNSDYLWSQFPFLGKVLALILKLGIPRLKFLWIFGFIPS